VRLTNSQSWFRPAFQVIRDTDPAVYRRMVASDWQVTAVDAPHDVDDVAEQDSLTDAGQVLVELQNSFGETLTPKPDLPESAVMPAILKYHTWLSCQAIEEHAAEMGVALPKFAADVLVHEFDHIEGGDESRARDAGTEFGRKLGEPAIIKMSERDRQGAVIESMMRDLKAKLEAGDYPDYPY
jgi:hypothetical protein